MGILFLFKTLVHYYLKNTTQRLYWSFWKEKELVYPDVEKVLLDPNNSSNQHLSNYLLCFGRHAG